MSNLPIAIFTLSGALGGSVITAVFSLLSLRMGRRLEHERWEQDHAWQHRLNVWTARYDAYKQFEVKQNAVIMIAGKVRERASQGKISSMPEDMGPIYEEEENAFADALLLAGPRVLPLITELHDYLNEIVWSSWEGSYVEPRPALFEDLLDAIQEELLADRVVSLQAPAQRHGSN